MVCKLRPRSLRNNPRAGEDVAEDITQGGDRALACLSEGEEGHSMFPASFWFLEIQLKCVLCLSGCSSGALHTI